MSGTTTEFLTRFFVEDLPFTPTARQIDVFQSDLSLVSPYLMAASLKEVKAGTAGNVLVYRPDEWREKIFEVYNRKVAEHAQLFPIFHTFETAFRSTVAVGLEDHYQHARWWRGIYQALRNGNPAKSITQISGVPLSKDAAHLIGQIIYAIDGDQLQRQQIPQFQNGFEFVECCDLIHIRRMIEKHWPIFSKRFAREGRRLTLNGFIAKFDRVRDARNDVYHHKSVAKLTGVVHSAEELLDYLNCSIQFIYSKMRQSTPVQPLFAITPELRHNPW